MTSSLISLRVLDDVRAEADASHARHGAGSLYWATCPNDRRLAVLAEELGEVARALNDASPAFRLRAELVQVAAVALTFIQAVDDGHAGPGSVGGQG
jgi:hypothetical protein